MKCEDINWVKETLYSSLKFIHNSNFIQYQLQRTLSLNGLLREILEEKIANSYTIKMLERSIIHGTWLRKHSKASEVSKLCNLSGTREKSKTG